MIKKIKRSLISIYRNLPGKAIGRKVVVIECDDWGGRGVPSINAYQKLKTAGLPMDESRYSRFDTLESASDLAALFEILHKHRDKNGNKAVMSPFYNTANPDFNQIKAYNYTAYFRESLKDTIKKYANGDVMSLWAEGIAAGIWMPEYHGREHLATAMWLKALRTQDTKLLEAFEQCFTSYSPKGVPQQALNFRPNFYIAHNADLLALRQDMLDGITLFNEAFGFSPEVFNAPNGVFIDGFDQQLIANRILFNAVPRQRLDRGADGVYRYKTFRTGQKSKAGMTYYVRNCNFEPTQKGYSHQHVISQIGGAFACKKAAIIATHRVNFVGGLSAENRAIGLNGLDALLKDIVKRWPEVEFMSSRQFTKLLQ
eukprot:Opistho-1_new@96116